MYEFKYEFLENERMKISTVYKDKELSDFITVPKGSSWEDFLKIKNKAERSIIGQIAQDNLIFQAMESKFRNLRFDDTSFTTSIQEFRSLWLLTPRRTNTTTEIAQIFNPDTDLYIALYEPMVDDFINKHNNLQINKNKQNHISNMCCLCISDIDTYSWRNNMKLGVERIFIETQGIMTLYNPEELQKVQQLIKDLDFLYNSKPIFIIT